MEKEKLSNQQVTASLKELQIHLGWTILVDRLQAQLTAKERVKAEAIRLTQDNSNNFNSAVLSQGWIDGVMFVMKEPYNIITKLKELENQGE